MGGVVKFSRRLILFFICDLVTWLLYHDVQFDSLCRRDDERYILNQLTESAYTLLSDNQAETNLGGLSNCVLNLIDEGYEIYSCTLKDDYADIIIQSVEKQSVYRYYYTFADHKLTCFCNVYENSWKGLTYILEKKERQ